MQAVIMDIRSNQGPLVRRRLIISSNQSKKSRANEGPRLIDPNTGSEKDILCP